MVEFECLSKAELISVLATIIFSLFGLFLAALAYNTSLHVFRFQLFDKRMEIYDATERLIKSGLTGRKSDNIVAELQPFWAAQNKATFLGFSEELTSYLDEVLSHRTALERAYDELEGLPGNRQEWIDAKHAEIAWLAEQFEKKLLKSKFHPYIGVKPIKTWSWVEKLLE